MERRKACIRDVYGPAPLDRELNVTMRVLIAVVVAFALLAVATGQVQQGDYFPQGIRVPNSAACSGSGDDGRLGRDGNGGLTLCSHDGDSGGWASYKGEKGDEGPTGPKGERGDDTLSESTGYFLGNTTKTYSFFLPGTSTTFYPVYFYDGEWSHGVFELMILRPSIHTDSQWWGSLTFTIRSHATSWGHGATWLETDLSYTARDGPSAFVGNYGMPSTLAGVIVWLAGGTTYYYRSNHRTEPAWNDPISDTFVLRVYNGQVVDQASPITSVSSNMLYGRNLHNNMGISSTLRVGTLNNDIGSYKLYVNGPSFFTDAPQSSDRRLKDTIEPLTAKYQPLETIQRLHGRTFEWRKTPADMHEDEVKEEMVYPEGTQMGLIADEVENVVPEIVAEVIQHGRSYRGLRYDKLNALLVEGIKELSGVVDRQKEEIQELESRLESMESKFDAMNKVLQELVASSSQPMAIVNE